MVAKFDRSDDPAKEALFRVRERISEKLKQVETGYIDERQDAVVNRFRELADKHDYETIIAEGSDYPDDPAVLLYVGMAHGFLGHFDEAQSSYWESLYRRSSLKEYSIVFVCLGALLEDRMRYGEAVNLWRIASHCNPENHMPHLNLMQHFCRNGQMEEVCREGRRLLTALESVSDPERRKHINAIVRSILGKKEQMEPFRASSDPKVVACREALCQAVSG